MQTKIIEIRDRATFLPVLAIKMLGETPEEKYYLRSTGYGEKYPLITVVTLSGQKASYDPFSWGDRTVHNAHLYIQENFVDKPKISERDE